METKVTSRQTNMQKMVVQNLIKNGNFINNSTNGYGSTPDDWTAGAAGYEPNQVQGGRPAFTKAEFLSAVGVADADLEGLWLLNEASGNATDLSTNGYDLTDTNTVTSSDDGLLGKARDFESGNSEYFNIADASCANLEISGAQTWFVYFKPESVPGQMHVLGKSNSATTNLKRLGINSNNKLFFNLQGLSTNDIATSDVVVEAGKWYLVIGVYDESSIKIHVNGVKKTATATGSANDTNGDFAIGRLGAWTSASDNYFDGLVQSAGVINGALTDAQVNKLWAFLGYQGIKTRDAGADDAVLYQTIDPSDAQRLAGKTVTLRAKMYQDEASAGTIGIGEDVATNAAPLPTVESTASTTTGEWLDISLTTTLSSDFSNLTVFLNAGGGTAGTVWFKEVALYESDTDLGYAHSPDDWNRFPRLLKMDIPLLGAGTYPYQFEEGRYYVWSPTWTGFSSSPSATYIWEYKGTKAYIEFGSASGTSNAAGLDFTLPIKCNQQSGGYSGYSCCVYDNGSWQTDNGIVGIADGFTAKVGKTIPTRSGNAYGGFTSSGSKGLSFQGSYEID